MRLGSRARRISALLAIALALAPVAAATNGVPEAVKPRVSHVRLANGLDVAVVENHAAPLAVVAVWYGTGSVDDPPGRSGLAHALEHMLYRGTRALSGPAEDELDERLGIQANASTDYETTEFHDLLPAESVEVALRIEAARMSGALLRESDWKVERGVVLAEIRARSAARSIKLRDAVRATVYWRTKYGNSSAGTLAGVSRITVADLRRAYARGYGPRNAMLVVTGDVVPARIFALARRIFGPIAPGSETPAAPDEEPVHTTFLVRTSAPGPDTLVDIALESRGAPGGAEAIAWELLDPSHEALAGPLVTRGPCSSYDAVDDTQSNGGMYHLICHLEPYADARAAVGTFLFTLEALARRRDAATYAVARRALRSSMEDTPDDLSSEASYFGSAFMQGGNPNRYRYPASDAAVANVLRRWSTPLAIGIASPTGKVSFESTPGAPDRTASGDRPPPQAPADGAVPLPAWARSALARPFAVRAPREPVSWFALPNGLRLAVQRRSGSGHAYVRAGFDEPNPFGEIGGGTGRVAAAIYGAGTRRWPLSRVTRAADRRALAVDVDFESNLSGSVTDLPLMFDILADAWRAPRIDARYLRGARRIAVTEAERFVRDPDRFAARFLAARIDDPAAPAPNPAADQRRADTSERAVRAFFRAHIRPERSWIAVVGDVEPVNVYRQAARAFGGWQVAPADPSPSAAPSAESPRPSGTTPDAAATPVRSQVLRVRISRPAVRVLFGARAPALGDADHDAMTLLDAVLGGTMEARLMRALRERSGLVYSVATAYDDRRGRFFISFQCAPRDRAAATALLRRTLDDLPARPPTTGELERVRGKLVGRTLLAQGSAGGMLDALADAARGKSGNEDRAALEARYRAVSAADVARVARTYLTSDRFIEVDEIP